MHPIAPMTLGNIRRKRRAPDRGMVPCLWTRRPCI